MRKGIAKEREGNNRKEGKRNRERQRERD